ncbi:MAG: hypothetical protein AB7V11_18040, partial [Pyrinomonadaceae bacterium]
EAAGVGGEGGGVGGEGGGVGDGDRPACSECDGVGGGGGGGEGDGVGGGGGVGSGEGVGGGGGEGGGVGGEGGAFVENGGVGGAFVENGGVGGEGGRAGTILPAEPPIRPGVPSHVPAHALGAKNPEGNFLQRGNLGQRNNPQRGKRQAPHLKPLVTQNNFSIPLPQYRVGYACMGRVQQNR